MWRHIHHLHQSIILKTPKCLTKQDINADYGATLRHLIAFNLLDKQLKANQTTIHTNNLKRNDKRRRCNNVYL